MQKPLPILLRKLLFALSILVLITIGIWLFSGTTVPTSIPHSSSTSFIAGETASTTEVQTADTDGDGLPTFEERLWGTDPEKTDTDGDGTSDGKEVALGRNPKKAGPHDSFETSFRAVEQPHTSDKPITMYTGVSGAVPPVSTPSSAETSEEHPLHYYGNAVGFVITEAGADTTTELALLNRIAGNKKMTTELSQDLFNMAKKYDRMTAKLASVIPPGQAVEVHRKLTDTYGGYAKAVHLFADTPLGSYISGTSTTAYSDSTLALGHAVVAVSDLFYREHITFGKGEPGTVFSFPR